MPGSRLKFSLTVMVPVLINNHIMIMLMRMRDSMRMRTSIVGVRKGVDMQMSVMPCNCIHDNKYRTCYHDNQRNKEDSGKFFPYQNE